MNELLFIHAKEQVATLALEVFLNDMRYINPRFTYLLTYLLTLTVATARMATATQIDLSYSHVAPLMHTHLIQPCYIRSVEVASPVSAEDAD